jgi:hypothetical protein
LRRARSRPGSTVAPIPSAPAEGIAVAVLVEEQALTLAVLDELPADDEAVRLAVRVGERDLGHPLLDQLLLGEVACASSLASTVALLAA